jgi:hypothetical protein
VVAVTIAHQNASPMVVILESLTGDSTIYSLIAPIEIAEKVKIINYTNLVSPNIRVVLKNRCTNLNSRISLTLRAAAPMTV